MDNTQVLESHMQYLTNATMRHKLNPCKPVLAVPQGRNRFNFTPILGALQPYLMGVCSSLHEDRGRATPSLTTVLGATSA